MAKYIFYTSEGFTTSPNNKKLNNLQVLGLANGKNLQDAIKNLTQNNSWIKEAGFNIEGLQHLKIMNKQEENNLKSIVDYLWNDERRHFEEFDEEKPKDHIYLKLKKVKELIS